MKSMVAALVFLLACGGKPDDKKDDKPAIDLDAVGPQPDGTVVLASRQNMVATIVADDRALYWIAQGGMERTSAKEHAGPSGVFRLAAGGPPVRLGDSGKATWLVQDATDLFLGDPEARTITRLPKAGGEPEQLVTGVDNISGIAVDETSLYYLAGAVADVTPTPSDGGIPRGTIDVSQGDSIWRVPKHGRAKPERVAADLGLASRLTLDGDAFYFAVMFESSIVRVPKHGGAVELVVKDPAIFSNWIAARGTIYYERRRADSGDLVRVARGGDPEVILHTTSAPGGAIALAGDTVYAATDDGTIHEVSPTGAKVLATRNLAPSSMIVRDRTLLIAEVFRVIAIPLR